MDKDSLRKNLADSMAAGIDPSVLAKIISDHVRRLERLLLVAGTIAVYQIAGWLGTIGQWAWEAWRG